jgi:hypothetical protein
VQWRWRWLLLLLLAEHFLLLLLLLKLKLMLVSGCRKDRCVVLLLPLLHVFLLLSPPDIHLFFSAVLFFQHLLESCVPFSPPPHPF